MTNRLTIENYPYNKNINGIFVPKSSNISIWIPTGTWDEYGPNYNYFVSASLGVELDNSGEDGVAAPSLSFPPLELTPHFTSVNDLIGKRIVEKWKDPVTDDYRFFWDGTFGNDLDGCLTSNIISFKEYSSQGFFIEWSADITNWAAEGKWGEKIGSMRFEGIATFHGVTLKVKKEGDEDEIIAKLFNTPIVEWNKYWVKSVLVDREIYGIIDPAFANLNSRVVNTTIEDCDQNWKNTVRRERTVYRNDPISKKQMQQDTTWYQITYLPK